MFTKGETKSSSNEI